ncbi:MAG: HAD family phosphatase [Chitinophagaceae bacterium]|nr:HAD family phosphatase [Chitinophagaceae bacterium]MBN8666779.1 HAD family phosphatase [Chitinophagales bacterium]MDX1955834.1 HAD family phosphatase [Chitinophagaceae bacterium]
MSKKIKAVIFDMDGVLIDARDWHYEALNKALGLFGMAISRFDHLVTYDGLPTREKLKMLTMEKGFPEGLHGFINDLKQQYTIEEVIMKCRPVFHHQYALSRLKSEGYKLVVCSNSIKDTITHMLTKAGIIDYFDFYLSNQDVKKGKPDPEMYTTAITRLGLKPDECLVVEDNENGIRAAVASGAHLLKVTGVNDVHYQSVTHRINELNN